MIIALPAASVLLKRKLGPPQVKPVPACARADAVVVHIGPSNWPEFSLRIDTVQQHVCVCSSAWVCICFVQRDNTYGSPQVQPVLIIRMLESTPVV